MRLPKATVQSVIANPGAPPARSCPRAVDGKSRETGWQKRLTSERRCREIDLRFRCDLALPVENPITTSGNLEWACMSVVSRRMPRLRVVTTARSYLRGLSKKCGYMPAGSFHSGIAWRLGRLSCVAMRWVYCGLSSDPRRVAHKTSLESTLGRSRPQPRSNKDADIR